MKTILNNPQPGKKYSFKVSSFEPLIWPESLLKIDSISEVEEYFGEKLIWYTTSSKIWQYSIMPITFNEAIEYFDPEIRSEAEIFFRLNGFR